MLCRIPYTYTVAGILKGHRKVEPYTFGAWTEAEVADVSSPEAPVSMSWEARLFGQTVRKETRWMEGANWSRPQGYDGGDSIITAEGFLRLNELEAEILRTRGGIEPSALIGEATGQDVSDLRSFLMRYVSEMNPGEFREVEYSSRREAEARAVDGSRNLAFIDGELWVKGGEPCYVLSVPGINAPTSHAPSIGVSPLPDPEWKSYAMSFFRADRLADASDYLRELSGQDAVEITNDIEILIPEAVQFDDEGEALLRCAREIWSGRAEGLRHASSQAVLTWLALRDGTLSDSPDLEALAGHLADARRSLAQYGRPAETIDKALKRWEMRPMADFGYSP